MCTAEKLARYFLAEFPQVTAVYLFGSCAMWGDGGDIDLVLEVSDAEMAYQFLKGVKEAFEEMTKRTPEERASLEWYGALKFKREDAVRTLLGWDDRTEIRQIEWDGRFGAWNSLCDQFYCGGTLNLSVYCQAGRLEFEHYRSTDLFLMPVGWQTDTKVQGILPMWSSNRPWARSFSFLQVLRLQARRFDSSTGHFGPRSPATGEEEENFRRARRLARRIYLKRRKEEAKELSDLESLISPP